MKHEDMLTKTWTVCLKKVHRNHPNKSVHQSLNPNKLIEIEFVWEEGLLIDYFFNLVGCLWLCVVCEKETENCDVAFCHATLLLVGKNSLWLEKTLFWKQLSYCHAIKNVVKLVALLLVSYCPELHSETHTLAHNCKQQLATFPKGSLCFGPKLRLCWMSLLLNFNVAPAVQENRPVSLSLSLLLSFLSLFFQLLGISAVISRVWAIWWIVTGFAHLSFCLSCRALFNGVWCFRVD